MSGVSVVYCHVGDSIPRHLYDSIYQTMIIHEKFQKEEGSIKIYIITNKKWVKEINEEIDKMNVIGKTFVIPCETLEKMDTFKKYYSIAENFPEDLKTFRGGFWLHTTTRFLYISAFMEEFNVEDVFHIESDVIIYENLVKTRRNLEKLNMHTKIVAVQDAPDRAVCSLVYLPTIKVAKEYADYVTQSVSEAGMKNQFLNDMDLMGKYRDKFHFPDSPESEHASILGVYDANGIGQYLGGIDFRNIPKEEIVCKYINPTRGFVNETATFKPNRARYMKTRIVGNPNYNGKKFIIGMKPKDEKDDPPMHELLVIHVHSKQLYLFSSVFDTAFEDIVTGDRVIAKCDFVLVDYPQFSYNKRLMKHNPNVILVKDFANVNTDALNGYFMEFHKATGKLEISLFVFIDIMKDFRDWILPKLDAKFKYIIYSHNGDYPFDSSYTEIINDPKIKKIYAQNVDVPLNPKVEFLPIGIARDLFPHGNLEVLYETMITTYRYEKEKWLYININESTHPFRVEVMNEIRNSKGRWEIKTGGLPFKEYLQELSKYRFCLCIRGNGLDTHRFWESIYLGVIPVIVYHPSMDNFIKYLKANLIPHYIVTIDFFKTNSETFFTRTLYNKIKGRTL